MGRGMRFLGPIETIPRAVSQRGPRPPTSALFAHPAAIEGRPAERDCDAGASLASGMTPAHGAHDPTELHSVLHYIHTYTVVDISRGLHASLAVRRVAEPPALAGSFPFPSLNFFAPEKVFRVSHLGRNSRTHGKVHGRVPFLNFLFRCLIALHLLRSDASVSVELVKPNLPLPERTGGLLVRRSR